MTELTGTPLLIEELERLPLSAARSTLLSRARRRLYHCFRSPIATPKMKLVDDLRAFGFTDIAGRAALGAFDDPCPLRGRR